MGGGKTLFSRVDQGALVVVDACVVIEEHHVVFHVSGSCASGFPPKERREKRREGGKEGEREGRRERGSEEVGGNHKQVTSTKTTLLSLHELHQCMHVHAHLLSHAYTHTLFFFFITST